MKLNIAIFFLLIGVLPIFSFAEKVRYDNHKVWSVSVETFEQLNQLNDVMEKDNKLLFLESPQHVGQTIGVVVPPSEVETFEVMVTENQLKNQIVHDNLQDLIDNEQPKTRSAQFNFDRYRTLDELYKWMKAISEEFNDVAEIFTIGYSWENRPINGVKIDFGLNELRTSIIIEAGIHSNEWITYETSAFIMNYILSEANDTDVQYLRQFTWYIFPTVNPDGLEYSKLNRMWRKTRSNCSKILNICCGTDGNRNFDYSFNMGGSSGSICSNDYRGPNAFSEPETRAIRDFVTGIKDDVQVYLSFHSFGQYVIWPYGHTTTRFNNYDDVVPIANKTAAAIQSVYGTQYTTGTAPDVLYPTSGGSRDWAKGGLDIPISLSIEMRPKSILPHGFILPADQIVPNAQEIIVGLVTLCKEGQNLNYLPFVAKT